VIDKTIHRRRASEHDRPVPKSVIVVGGGFSGLLTAIEFGRRGIPATVVEATDRPGGVARTVREDGYLLEPAASTFMLPHPDLSPLLHPRSGIGRQAGKAQMP